MFPAAVWRRGASSFVIQNKMEHDPRGCTWKMSPVQKDAARLLSLCIFLHIVTNISLILFVWSSVFRGRSGGRNTEAAVEARGGEWSGGGVGAGLMPSMWVG